MGFLQDLTPVFQKHSLRFVKSEKESGNAVSFYFSRPHATTWRSGQHGIFSFSRKMKGRSWRGFSIASSPREELIRITTRVGKEPSEFKKALAQLKPGDEISMRGPFGPFHLGDFRGPVVFIAGGIGITPYRALILHAARNRSQGPESIRLLYSDDAGQYVFRRELDELAAQNDHFHFHYLTSPDLPAKIAECVRDAGDRAVFYLSGPVRMVRSLQKSLRKQGVPRNRIRYERFFGLSIPLNLGI